MRDRTRPPFAGAIAANSATSSDRSAPAVNPAVASSSARPGGSAPYTFHRTGSLRAPKASCRRRTSSASSSRPVSVSGRWPTAPCVP
ncbi:MULTISPECIES: hypothetical protein [unclassified Streptomyces]|uniref:hypothetical protein n=1 Tax=unclassified Streptomyces TaxID=2593676 RepID=UPI000DC77A0A|nr:MULTISPECIES: hypothetical protein [unclassified Streptomyces]AWZ08837.1 hypothetical protein DRB89_34665 [Streptomyces sp. ICC4]AWZ15659.1 hypothetical protein DRB96_29210 [Streptomyces sp. ICC1]